jgi:hypothetical protein
MRGIGLLAVGFAMAAASPALAQGSRTADFHIGTVAFEFPLPDGYCLPEGKVAEAAATLASVDTQNVTELTIVPCGKAFENDFYAIKAPRAMIDTPAERAPFLQSLAPVFGTPGHDQDFAAATSRAADDFSTAIGKRVDMSGALKPLGVDSMCAYIGGLLTVSADEESQVAAVAGCVTVIGGRAIYVYSVGHGNTPEDVVRHVRESRALAERVRVKPER